MAGHSSLRSDSECWTDGSDKVLNHHPSDSSVEAGPCGVCWLPEDLFLHQAWVKYLLISLTFFCFNLLEVPDGEGFTVSEQFKECLVSCQSQSGELTL